MIQMTDLMELWLVSKTPIPCCHVIDSIYHNSKQPWLRFSIVKALFFEQVTLYSNWKSYRSSGTPSVVSCSNAYINLQTLTGRTGCAPQNTQFMLENVNCFTYMKPVQVYHPILSSPIALQLNWVPEKSSR